MIETGAMESEDRSRVRVVLLNDERGTVLGLAYGEEHQPPVPCLQSAGSNSRSAEGESQEQALMTTRSGQRRTEDRAVMMRPLISEDNSTRRTTLHMGRQGNATSGLVQGSRSRNGSSAPVTTSYMTLLNRLKVSALKCVFPDSVEELVSKLSASESLHTRERAASALADLSHVARANKLKIAASPRALEGLVDLLLVRSSVLQELECTIASAQTEAARALVSLACAQENKWKIAEFPNALTGLVKVILVNDDPDAKKWAAQALGNLSTHSQEVRLKIGNCPYALAGLVRLINKDKSFTVREQAARALAHLMSAQPENKSKIARIPHAVGGLVKLLSLNGSSGVQKMGALALAKLNHNEEILHEIADFPNALPGLVALLSKDGRPRNLLGYAATALGSVTRANDNQNRRIPESPPDSFAVLVGVLLNCENTNSQERAARALATLVFRERRRPLAVGGGGSCRSRAGFYFEAEELDGPGVQEQASRVQHFLECAREKQLLMAELPDALIASVGLLPKEGTRTMPVCASAAMALASLARAHANRRKIAEAPGALEDLVRLLTKNEYPGVQAHAACALANLAHSEQQIRLAITNIPGAVASLVGLLPKQESPPVQAQAARALACLQSVRDWEDNSVVTAEFPNILTDLVCLLYQSENAGVQEQAAWALANFGHRILRI